MNDAKQHAVQPARNRAIAEIMRYDVPDAGLDGKFLAGAAGEQHGLDWLPKVCTEDGMEEDGNPIAESETIPSATRGR